MKLPKVGQVAIVVKDVEKAARYLEQNFGMGPFNIFEVSDGKAMYKGNEVSYKSRIGMGDFQGMTIELMQPIEGNTIHNDPEFLPPGGQGVHHVGFYTEDPEALAEEFEKQGGKILQKSWPMPGAMTIYLDTPQYAGMLVELIKSTKR